MRSLHFIFGIWLTFALITFLFLNLHSFKEEEASFFDSFPSASAATSSSPRGTKKKIQQHINTRRRIVRRNNTSLLIHHRLDVYDNNETTSNRPGQSSRQISTTSSMYTKHNISMSHKHGKPVIHKDKSTTSTSASATTDVDVSSSSNTSNSSSLLTWFQISSQYGENIFKKASDVSSSSAALEGGGCQHKCVYVKEEALADVVFELPLSDWSDLRKRAARSTATGRPTTYVAQWWEAKHDPYIKNPRENRRQYPYSISYRADASFPCFGMIHGLKRALLPSLPPSSPSSSSSPSPSSSPSSVAVTVEAEAEETEETKTATTSTWPPTRVPFSFKTNSTRTGGALMSAWISSYVDRSGRMALLRRLMEHGVGVTAYGRIRDFKNIQDTTNSSKWQFIPPLTSVARDAYQPQTQHGGGGGGDVVMNEDLLSNNRAHEKIFWSGHYLFLFAAENTIAPYYHTEKVVHGLLAGTIPVYLGDGTTIREYVPEHSIISASDFDFDAEKLARYLLRVASNETLYESYFKWHNKPLPDYLKRKLMHSCSNVCDMCDYFYKLKMQGELQPSIWK